MGTIRAHEFTTIDGVVDEPTFTFGYEFDPRMGEAIGSLMGSCEAILLGRKTYQMFEPAWSARTPEDDPGAAFMNETAKFVVSSALQEATWKNSEILGRYDAQAIRRLKDRVDGGIYLSGSATLLRALIADDLLDELHLFVFPTTLGAGTRLFTEPAPRKWSLKRSEAYANGAVYLVYGARGDRLRVFRWFALPPASWRRAVAVLERAAECRLRRVAGVLRDERDRREEPRSRPVAASRRTCAR